MVESPDKNKPICTRCIYFYLTYDYAKPYGCKAMGFKSKMSPSLVVLQSSGMECQLYTPKDSQKGGDSSKVYA